MCKANPNLNLATADGSSPSELAVFTGQRQMLQTLLAHKADPSYARASRDGNSLLMMAAFKGHFDIAKDLCAAGADFNHENHKGQFVGDILSSVHQKYPYEVGLPDDEALMASAENNEADIMQLCLENGTPTGIRNQDGLSVLALASYFASVDCVKLLIKYKADPNSKGTDGSTPLLLAVFEGHTGVVQMLTEGYGDELDQTIALSQNTTALYLACQENRVDMVQLLLRHSKVAMD